MAEKRLALDQNTWIQGPESIDCLVYDFGQMTEPL